MKYTQATALIILCFMVSIVYAQAESRPYTRFRVLLKDGQRIEGTRGVLKDSTLEGRTRDGNPLSIPKKHIRAMDAHKRTLAKEGIGIGATVGLLIGLEVMGNSVSNNSDASSLILATVGITAIGVGIGAAVGSAFHRWERIPIRTAISFDPKLKTVKCIARLAY